MYSKIPLLPNPKSEIPSRKPLAIGNCTAQFVLGLVGNPKKFCSCDAAHIIMLKLILGPEDNRNCLQSTTLVIYKADFYLLEVMFAVISAGP